MAATEPQPQQISESSTHHDVVAFLEFNWKEGPEDEQKAINDKISTHEINGRILLSYSKDDLSRLLDVSIFRAPLLYNILHPVARHRNPVDVHFRDLVSESRPTKPELPPVVLVEFTCSGCGLRQKQPDGVPCSACFTSHRSSNYDEEVMAAYEAAINHYIYEKKNYDRRLWLCRRLQEYFPDDLSLRHFVGSLDVNFLFRDRTVVNTAINWLADHDMVGAAFRLDRFLRDFDERKRTNFKPPSQSSSRSESYRDDNFRRNLKKLWGNPKPVKCCLSLVEHGEEYVVSAAHIVEVEHRDDLTVNRLEYREPFDVNNPRNGMFLWRDLELAFDGEHATVVCDEKGDYFYYVYSADAPPHVRKYHKQKLQIPKIEGKQRTVFARSMHWHSNDRFCVRPDAKFRRQTMIAEGYHVCDDLSLESNREAIWEATDDAEPEIEADDSKEEVPDATETDKPTPYHN